MATSGLQLVHSNPGQYVGNAAHISQNPVPAHSFSFKPADSYHGATNFPSGAVTLDSRQSTFRVNPDITPAATIWSGTARTFTDWFITPSQASQAGVDLLQKMHIELVATTAAAKYAVTPLWIETIELYFGGRLAQRVNADAAYLKWATTVDEDDLYLNHDRYLTNAATTEYNMSPGFYDTDASAADTTFHIPLNTFIDTNGLALCGVDEEFKVRVYWRPNNLVTDMAQGDALNLDFVSGADLILSGLQLSPAERKQVRDTYMRGTVDFRFTQFDRILQTGITANTQVKLDPIEGKAIAAIVVVPRTDEADSDTITSHKEHFENTYSTGVTAMTLKDSAGRSKFNDESIDTNTRLAYWYRYRQGKGSALYDGSAGHVSWVLPFAAKARLNDDGHMGGFEIANRGDYVEFTATASATAQVALFPETYNHIRFVNGRLAMTAV